MGKKNGQEKQHTEERIKRKECNEGKRRTGREGKGGVRLS